MNPTYTEVLGTVLFGLAILHTFSVKLFQHLALKFREGSVPENFFHLLGEVEIIFGLWAGIFILALGIKNGWADSIELVNRANFTEPLFVFAIMTITATSPVIHFATRLIQVISSGISYSTPLTQNASFYLCTLVIGPLLGSLVTEPAAMTVTALILKEHFYSRARQPSERFMYSTLGTLFVNVSIGGVLTHFAAPPVLMVAHTWKWNTPFVFANLGWKASLAVLTNATLSLLINIKEIRNVQPQKTRNQGKKTPTWLVGIHLLALFCIVLTSHHPKVFLGVFLFFLGITTITQEYQKELQLKQSLLVGFFLGGLVVLGGIQNWWLEPLLHQLDLFPLFLGTTAMTAFTDNAALTYLGSLIPNTTDSFRYALVAGAVAGGGLTVIANAPNPAGFSILRENFGSEGISPTQLALGALLPTVIAMICFWCLS